MDTSRWTERLDSITASFRTEFGQLTPAELNLRPSNDVWSIAQNIEHLILVNESYYPVLSDVVAGRYSLPWTARFGFIVRFFGKVILQSVSPDRKRKMKTFPMWEPRQSAVGADILDRFEQHQFQLKELVRRSSELLDKGTVISSPANRNVVYTLATAFDIIVTHEQRHFEQARELKALLQPR